MKVAVVEAGRLEHETGGETGTAVAGHLHRAVLLDPEFAHDHVVDATVDVGPRVSLAPPEDRERIKIQNQMVFK